MLARCSRKLDERERGRAPEDERGGTCSVRTQSGGALSVENDATRRYAIGNASARTSVPADERQELRSELDE